MEIIGQLLSKTVEIFKLPLTLFGFTFSYWEVFCFGIVASILAYIIGGFFSGDR